MFNNKFKKYKKVYFIDCENVGFELPFPIDKNAYYYYFCNNNAKIDFNSVNTLMNHRNIGLYTHTASKQKKNSLDFCIVVELTKMVLKYKENKWINKLDKDVHIIAWREKPKEIIRNKEQWLKNHIPDIQRAFFVDKVQNSYILLYWSCR